MSKYLKHSSNTSFIPSNALLSGSASPLVDIHYSKDKIRKRISYAFWSSITDSISNDKLSLQEKVRCMHVILNDRMMFNTEKQAGFDAESAEQVLLDTKNL
jgi:hypothetical protein